MGDPIFISYSHNDRKWLDELRKMLAPLVRAGTIEVLWDGEIRPSETWRAEIEEALASARLAVLLVSPSFLASDYIIKVELPFFLAAAQNRKVKILWALVSQCLYEETPLKDIQALHDLEKPLAGLPEAELNEALKAICKQIVDAAKEVWAPRPTPTPNLPPPPRCFGRKAEVKALVGALCADSHLRPVPVLGPAGVGKSTVTAAALLDSRVAKRFGSRRWFILCGGTTNRDALLGEIASGIGFQPVGGQLEERVLQLEERVFRELARGRGALVLDNLETPWEMDQGRVEALLEKLGGVPKLALAASIRGDERPLGPNWTEAIRIGPLPLAAARDAFSAVAGKKFRNDPYLDRLLEAVDKLPLAVILLAKQAEGDPTLSNLWDRWQHERTALLRRGSESGRLRSLEVSLEMSIKSRRMTDEARSLMTLLGVLPDGISQEDLPVLLPDEGGAASTVLRKVGLAYGPSARLLVLAPVRDHVAEHHPPSTEDLGRIRRHYLRLAELGKGFGMVDGAVVVERLSPELGNLEAMIGMALADAGAMEAMAAVEGLAELVYFTGLGTSNVIERALEAAERTGEIAQQATCLVWLGDISRQRSHYQEARDRYEQALRLFKGSDSVVGLAKCNKRLGDMAMFDSNLDAAQTHYHEALTLYKSIDGTLGEGNCIKRLGDIDLRRNDLNAARARYDQAVQLYRRVNSVLGEANCIKGLGDIALASEDHDLACDLYKQALPLYQGVGDLLGEANCIEGLGDVALARKDNAAARAHYEQALPLFRRVGDSLGEASCLGHIESARGS